MRKIISILLVLLACLTTACSKQPAKSAEMSEQERTNRAIFDSVYSLVKGDTQSPMQQLVTNIAQQFLETDYVASTLEEEPEELRVFLDKTDCILFVELCSSFALTTKGLRIVQAGDGKHFRLNPKPSVERAEPSYELLCDNIRNMRYRIGNVEDYASRIHYTSEWILQNQTNGILREYSAELGEEFEQKFYFMSTHRDNYKQLADSMQLMKIQAVENHLNEQKPFYFISQDRLRQPEIISQIQSGDIVCFMSKQGNGIDIAHVAIAFAVDGEMHFIHASYGAKKVKIEEKTLAKNI